MYNFLFFLLCFVMYKIGPISLADWVLILLDFLALLKRPVFTTNHDKRIGGSLILAGTVLSFALNVYKPWFSLSEFVGSAGKLGVYIISLGILPNFLRRKKVKVVEILSGYIYFISLNAIFQFIMIQTLGRENVVFRFLYRVTDNDAMFRYHQLARVRTFYNEPGFMAIHVALIFIVILFIKKEIPMSLHIAYLISVAATVSLSALFVTAGIYLIYYWDAKRRKNILKMLVGGIAIMLLSVFVIMKVDFIRIRFLGFITLNDHSAILRTLGTFHFLVDTPWYGTGIGNNALYYKSLGWGDTFWYSQGGEAFNVLVVAALTMGYIGLIGLLIYQYSFLKHNKKLFLAFLLTQFGWGLVFSTPIWTFLLMCYLAMDEEAMLLQDECCPYMSKKKIFYINSVRI